MFQEQIDARKTGGRSGISIATTRETSKTNCALFVDKRFVSLGVRTSTAESSTATASVAPSQRGINADQHSCIYKRSAMARRFLCLRYLLTATFILLGVFGAVVCGTGSYFVHELHGPLTNAKSYGGPPILLLTAGIANMLLGPYFWFFFDAKYNPAQLFMFLILVILVGIIEGIAGVWAIADHNLVDASISKILENNLASVGTINDGPAWNLTEIKVNCCGFEKYDYEVGEGRKITWSCCNTRRYIENQLDDDDVDLCAVFYINECRDLALHRYRSILFFTFIVALCATIIQILESIFLYAYAKRLMKKRRRRSTVAVVTSSNQRSQMTCPVMQLGAHHVCEGCANEQYRER